MGTTIKANIISGNTIKANVEAGGNIRVNAVTGSVKSTTLPDVVIKAFIKDQGPIGPKGDTGPANSLDIGTVESGITPSATITGTAPTQTLNLTLPKGDKGDKGETGVGITEETVGFTLTGGTTPKTLTVPLDATIIGTNTGDNSTNTSCIAKTTNITALNETGIADDEIAVFNLTNKDIRTSNKTIVTTLGSDDTTVPTSKAVKDNIPVKVVGSEVDTGTDDAKFLTAKSINDSHNIPLVTPSTSGNLMTSNGTDWISSTPPVSVSVTTKGDIQTYSTTPDRLPVGSDGQILEARSTETTGLKWIAPPSATDLNVTASPASDHTASGLKIILTATDNMAFGDVGYIASTGKVSLIDADAIATMTGIVMCADATINADASGNFLLLGIARDDTWNWTVGGLIYGTVTGTSGNTLSQTAPTGTDDVVQIMGIATHADRMYFNPQLVQVEHI